MSANKLYINIWDYKNDDYPFQFFLGGRGIGKTYSFLAGAVEGQLDDDARFIQMRRTADAWELQLDTDKGEGANPYKKYNMNNGTSYGVKKINKKIGGIYRREIDEQTGKLQHVGQPLGYTLALSTIASIRGIDFSDCTDWVYDEFIKEKHEKEMRGECDAFLNAYESINRNRELEGLSPVRVWFLSNASDIYNPIFRDLGLVSICEQMQRKHEQHKYIKDRGLAIHLLDSTEEFKEKKRATALYRLSTGSRFSDMALSNDFAYNDFSLIEARSLKGYQPICSINDRAYFYRKKGSNDVYVTYAKAKCPNFNCETENERRAFMSSYGLMMMRHFVNGKTAFESYELKALTLDIIL